MSEDEIIETIEELQCEYKEQENEKKYNDYTVFKAKKYSKGLEGLLDLYQKEKEKNMELELENIGLKENRRIAIEEIQEEYFISKDKIREIIEDCYRRNGYTALALSRIKELLEE